MVEFIKTFSINDYNELNKIQNKKNRVVVISICFILIIFGLFFFLLDSFEFGLFCVLFGLIYPFIFLFFIKKSKNKTIKTNNLLSNDTLTNEHYMFYEDHFEIIVTKGDDYYSLTKSNYSYLYKVVETVDSFLLYISNNQAHVLFKKDLTKGTIEELESFLISNIKSKFIKE